MPISDRIGPHLPALRRYARALSGSQASGDNPFTLYSFGADAKAGGEGQDADVGYPPGQIAAP